MPKVINFKKEGGRIAHKKEQDHEKKMENACRRFWTHKDAGNEKAASAAMEEAATLLLRQIFPR